MIVCVLISGCCSRRPKFKSWTLAEASHGCVEGAKRCDLGGQRRRTSSRTLQKPQGEFLAEKWTKMQDVSSRNLSRSVLGKVVRCRSKICFPFRISVVVVHGGALTKGDTMISGSMQKDRS